MKKKRLVIANKFRFTVFMVCTFLLLFSVVGTAIGINTAQSAQITEYHQVYVQSGDTLWSLANQYGAKNVDKRKIIYEISSLNNLDNNYIYPGQKLKVPVYEKF